MTRLTNHIKLEVICAAVEKAGIHVQKEALRIRRAKWAESVRIQAVGGKDIGVKPAMQLPAIKTEDLNAMIGIPTEN